MSKFFKCFLFVLLCGCNINTPSLPPLDKPSFSYERLMQQKNQLEAEIKKHPENSPKPRNLSRTY